MIWITTTKNYTTIPQMSIVHLENCIKLIRASNKPSDKIFGYKAKRWIEEMSNELIVRNIAIAQLENLKKDLQKMNKELLVQFNECNNKIKNITLGE